MSSEEKTHPADTESHPQGADAIWPLRLVRVLLWPLDKALSVAINLYVKLRR